jgi:hypothetical protein
MADHQLKPKPLPPEERATLAWAEGDMQHPPPGALTLDTLNFLCEILATISLLPTHPDYLATATKIQKAKDELIAAVTALDVDL